MLGQSLKPRCRKGRKIEGQDHCRINHDIEDKLLLQVDNEDDYKYAGVDKDDGELEAESIPVHIRVPGDQGKGEGGGQLHKGDTNGGMRAPQ